LAQLVFRQGSFLCAQAIHSHSPFAQQAMAGLHWPGLMQWSTQYHDGTAPSNFKVLSAEDRAFLEKAMEEAFGKMEDPNKVLKECIEQIKAETRTDESITTALEVIDRLCDDVDVARNVEKLDGLQALLDLTNEKGDVIRERTLEILALLFSNNPNIQAAGVKRGALQIFLKFTQEAPVGSTGRSKAFRGVVALIRQVEEFEETFLHAQGGIALLVRLLDPAEDVKTREKAASFALSCAANGRLTEDDVATLASALAPLLLSLSTGGIQYREVLSDCAQQFARATFGVSARADAGQCAAVLGDAAQARLVEIRAGAKEEGDEGIEEANLQGCLETLGR